MKLTSALLIMAILLARNKAYSQITLKEKNAPLEKVLADIEKQTKYVFLYDPDELKMRTITIDIKNASLQRTLEKCFQRMPIEFSVLGNNVLLRKKRSGTHQK
jgi:type II secretory pathway component GspD/PulD (secretin)